MPSNHYEQHVLQVIERKPITFSSSEYVSFVPQEVQDYEGVYSVTPSSQKQVLNTASKMMLNDVTIEPIPNNYGLIGWDGSVLTIS